MLHGKLCLASVSKMLVKHFELGFMFMPCPNSIFTHALTS
jgi:hypothetical protein